MNTQGILLRNALMRGIRAFFYDRDYVEVETPLRLAAPCMELHIDAEPCGDGWLRTSPELCHKQLLAAGVPRLFEIGKCFRQGECGRLHHPEYTMLEWYRAEGDYEIMLKETRALIEAVWPQGPDTWHVMTVADAFERFAGWNPVAAYDEERFDIDLVEKVEPAIRSLGGAVFLKDYPAAAAALARCPADRPGLAERWELYVDGVELANAYSELTDAREQRRRFESCGRMREASGRAVYPLDEAFLTALAGMPEAGGVALGVDRLLMLMAGARSLDDVLPFRQPAADPSSSPV